MRAALLVRPHEIVVDEVPDPEPGPGEVRIRVAGVGLCGSDMSVFSGKWKAAALPWIMGHEAFGTIDAVGELVQPARLGELVVVEPNIACFRCAACRRGMTSACSQRQSVGMNRPGALAERLVIRSEFAWRIEEHRPETLACVEPLTVVGAALRRLSRPLPASALVIGAGPQGLLACLELSRRGVRVHALEINPQRAAFALQLGAEGDPGDEKFELIVDTVGSPDANASAIGHIEVGGTILVLGLDDRPLGLTAQTIVRRQLELRGSLTYDHPADFAATIDLLASGAIEPGRIVTHGYALDEVQDAFERSPAAPGKSWIRIGV